MQIGMAQSGKGGAQDHLAAPRLFERDLLDRQGLVRLMQHGGFHSDLPLFGAGMLTSRGLRVTPGKNRQARTSPGAVCCTIRSSETEAARLMGQAPLVPSA